VDLEWLESHGPPVTAPVAEGFGIGFMRRSVEYELDGNFTQQFVADGILCRINFPLSRNRAEVPRVTASRA
jgi:two-component sensor histidine kinase